MTTVTKEAELTPIRVKFVYPKYPDGSREVLALFLGTRSICRATGNWEVDCYAHVGQHGTADVSFLRRKLATKEQYEPLLKELESIGYKVTVVNKN